jgi:hypothetical protein
VVTFAVIPALIPGPGLGSSTGVVAFRAIEQ